MRELRTVARTPLGGALLGVAGAYVAVWVALPLDGLRRALVLGLLLLVPAALAAAACLLAAGRPDLRPLRRALLVLGAGALAWPVGQVGWDVAHVLPGGLEGPWPASPVAGVAPFAGTAALAVWPRRRRPLSGGELVDVVLLAAVLVLAGLELVIEPSVHDVAGKLRTGLPFLTPASQLLLAVVVVSGLLAGSWRESGRLALLAGGLAALVAADATIAAAGPGAAGGAAELGWTAMLCVIGLAALLPPGWRLPVRIGTPSLATTLVPLVLLVGICARMLEERWGREPAGQRAELVALFVLLLGIVARHAQTLRALAGDAARQRLTARLADPELPGLDDRELAAALLAHAIEAAEADGGTLALGQGERRAVASAGQLSSGNAQRVELRRNDELLGQLELAVPRKRPSLAALGSLLARELDRVHVQRELRQEQERRRAAMEASRTGVCLYSAAGEPVFWNSAFARLCDVQDAGLPMAQLLEQVRRTSGSEARGEPGEEWRFWKGERFLALRFAAAGGELLLSVDDLTDQERERATRDRFVAEVLGAQEREARRIAELVHDDAVQELTALGLELDLAAARTGDPILPEVARSANAITASLRRLLVQLHPAVLESRGVGAALDAAAGSLRAHGIEVDVEPFGERLAPELEHLLYRIALEALTNALRHAEAARVEVRLELDGDRIRCTVADDGRGIDPGRVGSALAEGRLGLHLMRERVELAGGRLSVGPSSGGGTTLRIELPLEPARQAVPLEEVRA